MKQSISALSKLSVLALLVIAGSTAQAQTQVIRIRVINVKDGRPLPQQHASAALLYKKGEKAPAKYDANPRLETDVNGEAQFPLPEPPPAYFVAQVRLTSEYWHCRCLIMAATQDLIQKGVVQPSDPEPTGPATNGKAGPGVAEPGVILFLVRPFTFLERLMYPLMKE